MGKLIRDGVPAVVVASGGRIATRTLSATEYETALRDKLVEEAYEAAAARTDDQLLEELADIYEVMCALVHLRGFAMADVELVARAKRKARGGFYLRLESIEYVAGPGDALRQRSDRAAASS